MLLLEKQMNAEGRKLLTDGLQQVLLEQEFAQIIAVFQETAIRERRV